MTKFLFGSKLRGKEIFMKLIKITIDKLLSWQEAILAWIDGKNIKSEPKDGSYYYLTQVLKQYGTLNVNIKDVMNYKWYICD
jgi:hypothetical protein